MNIFWQQCSNAFNPFYLINMHRSLQMEIPRAFVCAESKIFDVSEWATCQVIVYLLSMLCCMILYALFYSTCAFKVSCQWDTIYNSSYTRCAQLKVGSFWTLYMKSCRKYLPLTKISSLPLSCVQWVKKWCHTTELLLSSFVGDCPGHHPVILVQWSCILSYVAYYSYTEKEGQWKKPNIKKGRRQLKNWNTKKPKRANKKNEKPFSLVLTSFWICWLRRETLMNQLCMKGNEKDVFTAEIKC
jgi:hypothetical protein